jgi:hypothetical protein
VRRVSTLADATLKTAAVTHPKLPVHIGPAEGKLVHFTAVATAESMLEASS